MNKEEIKQRTGTVVGFQRKGHEPVMPVRILDGRLWEIHFTPQRHLELSAESHPVQHRDVHVGYPVLALFGAHGEFQQEREQNEQWLAETTLTLADILNEQGEDKGILPKGVILKVVSGRSLTPDYARARDEREEREKEVVKAWKGIWEDFDRAREKAEQMNFELLAMGLANEGDVEFVVPQGVGSTRVNIEVDLLDSLLKLAAQSSHVCVWCGAGYANAPRNNEAGDQEWLCPKCHPDITV